MINVRLIMRNLFTLMATLVPFVLLSTPAAAQSEVVLRYPALHHPVSDSGGMVVAQNRIAAHVGAEILAAGGNAVDAGVAVGFALAVTLPRAGNLGGGGFMLVHLADENKTVAIDYREMAPAAATHDMYLDAEGNVDNNASRFSRAASGVPGTVAGLYYAQSRYGTMRWRDVLKPAIELAEKGVVMSADMASSIGRARKRFERDDDSMAKFFKADGSNYQAGDVFKQKDLAKTLRLIAREGPSAFYEGRIADLIVADMGEKGGIITHADLKAYTVAEREPVTGTYRGYDIVSMPPTSSGGVHVVQMLNVLEHFPMASYGHGSALATHVLIEAMRQAYADRSQYLGDMDFFDVPIDWLTSKTYAKQIAASIDMTRSRRSADVGPGVRPAKESPDTTHYSVMDKAGNVVANTYTLNFSFGSGHTVKGAGFLMNNEMDDFSAKPGSPNAFGMLGGEANKIEPGKRPLSSMTPTLVFKDGKPFMATGSPGGSRIITTVLQQIVNVIDFGMNISDSVDAPRIHHQWYPDSVSYERGLSPDTAALLKAMGHTLAPTPFTMGSVQAILVKDGVFQGAADPRRPDSGAYGPASIACEASRAACGR